MHRTEREGKFPRGRNFHPAGIQTNKSCEEVCIPGTLTPSKYAYKRFMQRKLEGFDAPELSPHF
jgi:hypothetical protein